MERAKLQTIAKQAVKRAGGCTRVARQIGLTKGAVSWWYRSPRSRGVPAQYLAVLAELSGIEEYDLRPDVLRRPE